MSHEISLEFKGDYIHVRHKGATNSAVAEELWRRVVAACAEHRCDNVLGESEPSGKPSVEDSLALVEVWRKVGVTLKQRIAWVNHDPRSQEMFEFMENLLKNRHMVNGHLFKDVAEAKRWLLSRADTPLPYKR